MKNYILCHGFNVKDAGRGTIDKLIPFLIGNIQQADYGRFNLFGVRWFNNSISRAIAGMSNVNSVGVGHSNGCAILVEAARYTPKIKQLILINPALDKDTVFPEYLDRVIVFHNIYDDVVTASKWIPWHVWGEMGRTGYVGDDPRVTNIDTFNLFKVKGHSAVFHTHAKQLSRHIEAFT